MGELLNFDPKPSLDLLIFVYLYISTFYLWVPDIVSAFLVPRILLASDFPSSAVIKFLT